MIACLRSSVSSSSSPINFVPDSNIVEVVALFIRHITSLSDSSMILPFTSFMTAVSSTITGSVAVLKFTFSDTSVISSIDFISAGFGFTVTSFVAVIFVLSYVAVISNLPFGSFSSTTNFPFVSIVVPASLAPDTLHLIFDFSAVISLPYWSNIFAVNVIPVASPAIAVMVVSVGAVISILSG